MVSRFDDPNEFARRLNGKIDKAGSTIQEAVQIAIDAGASNMRENIMTRGTNKEWSSSWPSRAYGRKSRSTEARFDTGEMRDSVTSRLLVSTKNRSAGEFGWLDNQEDYFKYQDKGFTHRNGAVIPAMNALRDARTYAISIVKEQIKRIFG